MNHFFLIAREALQKDIPFLLVMKLLYLEVPKIFVLTIPMAILFGILIGIGRLVSDSEIVTMQASGISTFKIFKSSSYLAILAILGLQNAELLNKAKFMMAIEVGVKMMQERFKLAQRQAELGVEAAQKRKAGSTFEQGLNIGGAGLSMMASGFGTALETKKQSQQSIHKQPS